MKEEFRVLSTTAILGYGFPVSSFEEGMKRKPHLIAVDAGSSDPGPYYLGAGQSFTDRGAVKRDLTIMLTAAMEHQIPVVIGTAGGSGADSHLDWCEEIILEIAKEKPHIQYLLEFVPEDNEKHLPEEAAVFQKLMQEVL